jgi:hypothetical protein
VVVRVPSLSIFLIGGAAFAACGWPIEFARGWQLDSAARRGEELDHE